MAKNVATPRTLSAEDTIRGQLGRMYSVIDGERREMLEAKNIEANFNKNKTEMRVMGTLTTKHRAAGWTGTGSMNVYYTTSYFRRMVEKYAKDGIDTYFELYLYNDDEGSNIGKQVIHLKRVNLNDLTLFKTDIDEDILDEDVDFTFEDFSILQDFSPIVGD
jgi:hypothetical protein